MASEFFFCPHCKRQLTKSAQAYVLSELQENNKSYFIGLGELAPTVTCPGCGKPIDTMKMIRGVYDRKERKATHPFYSLVAGVCYFAGGILTAGILHEGLHWSWLPSLLVGILGGLLLGEIVVALLYFLVSVVTGKAWKK